MEATQIVKHTQGPWITDDLTCRFMVYSDDAAGSAVADCRVKCAVLITDEQRQANCKLIAAAPDLLKALEAFIEYEEYIPTEIIGNAKSAIKKAIL